MLQRLEKVSGGQIFVLTVFSSDHYFILLSSGLPDIFYHAYLCAS
jgi:hypothetical protein